MKKILFTVVAVLLVLSVCACTTQNEIYEEEELLNERNGVISLQMRDPDTLDPIKTEKQSVRDGLLTIYEPLFNITEDFSLENVLAEAYAFNESATVLTVKVKEGVLWHNNHVFSADDVIYTVEKIKSYPQSSYYLNLEKLERAEKLNDYEVAFYLKEPYSLFVYNLYFPIMHVNTEGESCMGTGAYKFLETDGKQLVLERNSAWHMGEVENDGVKFIYLKTSQMAQEAFSSGKIHAVTNSVLDTENFAIKESNKKYSYPNGLFEFMGFNTKAGVFSDAQIRSAAATALDRDEIAKAFDDATVSPFPVMKGSGAFTPIYETVDLGSEYAMEAIFSAGWRDDDNDGRFEKAVDGEIVKLKVNLLVSNQDSLRVSCAKIIEEQLESAGFTVDTDIVNIDEFNMRVYGGEFDVFLGAVYYNSPYDMAKILSSYGNVNYMGYANKDMDKALDAFSSAADIDTATVAFSKIQSLYTADQPIAGLVFRKAFIVTSKAIEGEVKPYPYSPYASVHKWKVK